MLIIVKILRIDLETKKIDHEDYSDEDEVNLIGGMGLATAIFTREVDPEVDPFDGSNLMIFSVGPFCGTAIPFCGRYFITSKSPLTRILGEASSGGFFGKELKSAGFDLVIIKGKSKRPVYLWINDGVVEIKDASDLWGKGTQETDEELKDLLGKNIKVATIGPAGENLVKYACIINDKHHAAGRCGMGAVMGSKNLKAIAIHGTGKVPVQDKEKVNDAAKELRELLKKSGLGMVMADSGTPVHIDSMASVGDIIIKNYTEGRWIGIKKIGAKALNARGEVKMHGCFNCPTACRGFVEYEGEWVSRPEYETLGMLGSNLMVNDLEALIKWNLIVNDLGLDSISLGAVIGCFLESIDRKLIDVNLAEFGFTEENVWGAVEPIEKLFDKIAYRKGIGDDLAEGVRSFCEVKGLPDDLSMHGKGLEIPAHEPRANNLTALDYATTPRGAYHCYEPMHLSSYMNQKEEIGLTEQVDRFGTGDDVAEAVVKIQDGSEAYSACGGCIFGFWFIHKLTPWINGLNGITGRSYTVDDFMKTGQEIVKLKRIFNVKCGISKADDDFGKRFYTPLEKGGSKKIFHR
ncbi:MAG: aldehyde ferredoxin oxidoreductase family protein [Promethearchaeota archaeon]